MFLHFTAISTLATSHNVDNQLDRLFRTVYDGGFMFLLSLQVFRVASVCLGSPPDTICWEYRDKDKNFHRMGPHTPQQFYREHVKPLYNIQDKVLTTSDRPHKHELHTCKAKLFAL